MIRLPYFDPGGGSTPLGSTSETESAPATASAGAPVPAQSCYGCTAEIHVHAMRVLPAIAQGLADPNAHEVLRTAPRISQVTVPAAGPTVAKAVSLRAPAGDRNPEEPAAKSKSPEKSEKEPSSSKEPPEPEKSSESETKTETESEPSSSECEKPQSKSSEVPKESDESSSQPQPLELRAKPQEPWELEPGQWPVLVVCEMPQPADTRLWVGHDLREPDFELMAS